MKCKICSEEAIFLNKVKIMGKYDVSYYRCSNCEFTQTENPYWIEEAYSDAITNTDVGLVHRNLHFSNVTKAIISLYFDKNKTFVDYGAGYGMFVRIMRDSGFDFKWQDEYCENLFAKGQEYNPNEKVELVTAFEVFEHLVDPLIEIDKMMKLTNSILFSTELLPKDKPKPGEWWYYGLNHGQHVAIYSYKTLEELAKKYSLNLYSNGKTLHLLTDKVIKPAKMFKALTHPKISSVANLFFNDRSLLVKDHAEKEKENESSN